MKNIAVVYGGYSSEHLISEKSGRYVASVIDQNMYEVYEILLSKDKWTEIKHGAEVNKNDFSILINNRKITFDAVVSVIHGNPGENGILQSYFDLLGIPYTGCSSFTSSLTFNKFYCNNYLRNFDFNIAESIIVRKNEEYKDILADFVKKAGLPIFVKPSDGGSSFGITKVKNVEELIPAINHAFEESNEVILEQFIKGREFTCGVVKTDKILALTPIEVRSKHEFFDYEAKYNSDLNQEIIPAPIDEILTDNVKKTSVEIYKYLNCEGIVRIDYILEQSTNKFYFLEINTIPGMTSESIVPKMLRYDKINITDLYTKLIEKAIRK